MCTLKRKAVAPSSEEQLFPDMQHLSIQVIYIYLHIINTNIVLAPISFHLEFLHAPLLQIRLQPLPQIFIVHSLRNFSGQMPFTL